VNPDDPADRELLMNVSPLFRCRQNPHSPSDWARRQTTHASHKSESEHIAAAIEKNGRTATYVLYPNEGHVLSRQANRMDFIARAENFLAEHLGGRCGPMEGERSEGSSALVRNIGPRSS
jgi:hypothetical protein